jgi:hypothetical protein
MLPPSHPSSVQYYRSCAQVKFQESRFTDSRALWVPGRAILSGMGRTFEAHGIETSRNPSRRFLCRSIFPGALLLQVLQCGGIGSAVSESEPTPLRPFLRLRGGKDQPLLFAPASTVFGVSSDIDGSDELNAFEDLELGASGDPEELDPLQTVISAKPQHRHFHDPLTMRRTVEAGTCRRRCHGCGVSHRRHHRTGRPPGRARETGRNVPTKP